MIKLKTIMMKIMCSSKWISTVGAHKAFQKKGEKERRIGILEIEILGQANGCVWVERL